MRLFVFWILFSVATGCFAQTHEPARTLLYTPVKDQAATGTCWSFSMTSLLESQSINAGVGRLDLSEMFTVRNIYKDKAKNYILRQGVAQFGPGGLGHDVLKAVADYGAVPEYAYSGLMLGSKSHDHTRLDKRLKAYLDSLLTERPLPADWMQSFERLLDEHLGSVPESFIYQEKRYTPKTFADEVLKFESSDYVLVTSFTHHPYYVPFILEVPDNYSNASYYNLPLQEMMDLVSNAVAKGLSVMWDADVSNPNFRQKAGFAMHLMEPSKGIDADASELKYDEKIRQELFENLTTQDDHLMHLVGVEKSPGGKKFFIVKNSWGAVGPFKGLIKVSEAYFAINTISLVVPKAAIDKNLKSKLGLQ